MCWQCRSLADDVTKEVLLAAAERELILAQADAGESVPHATRPLSAAEKRAKMRFKEIDDLQVSAAEKAAKLLAGNRQVYIMAIIGAIFGAERTLEPDQAVAAYDALMRGEMPPEAVKATDTVMANMGTILATVFAGGSLIALGEARRQGGRNLPKPLEAPKGRFDALARTVAAHPWTRLTSKLQSDVLAPANLTAPIARPDVEKTLTDIPLDGAEDLARQSIHMAHGQGRNETVKAVAEKVGGQPSSIHASELLDGETCQRCFAVDGKEYATLEEADVEYERGYYGACLGGSRCRGCTVAVYGFGG